MSIVPPTDENIRVAAQAILNGELVVIPTETVYGLAADATNRRAVLAIFAAKGRPAENPLIVHIGDPSWMDDLVVDVPDYARKLASEFWPGPLTLVLRKLPHVLDEVTAGLDSVAVRMPQNEIALKVILEAGVPVAAPSANRFMQVSPTRAEHIDPEIESAAAMVLDGGPCAIGLESTVVECLGSEPRILRPGGISRNQIEELLGITLGESDFEDRRSPGQYPRHYAPCARVVLVDRLGPADAGLTFSAPQNSNQIQMKADPADFGSRLYESFHLLDDRGIETICIERPPETPEWEVVWDRIKKSAG